MYYLAPFMLFLQRRGWFLVENMLYCDVDKKVYLDFETLFMIHIALYFKYRQYVFIDDKMKKWRPYYVL